VRYFLRRRVPEPSRILLVESGSRRVLDMVLPRLRAQFASDVPIDLVTCFPTAPSGLANIYNVNDYRGSGRRLALARELRAQGFSIAGIVCSGEPILTKWKWALAVALPAKLLIINENGDCFWLDRGHWGNIRQFVRHRAGLADAGIVRAAARLVVFPFTLTYLLLYAAAVHFRRALNRGFR
jgi:hypothetical protein